MWFVATKSLMTCEEIKLHTCMSWMSVITVKWIHLPGNK